MLVVVNNEQFYEYSMSQPVTPLKCNAPLVIVIDPSKTNMCLMICNEYGEIIQIIEFSGNNRGKGTPMDTMIYCEQFRSFLKQYLSMVKIEIVGIEAAITVSNKKSPYSYHHSNMVLTEIRANVRNLFLEEFKIKAIDINNWAWKKSVLPDGYRGQNEKGSKRFVRDYMPNSTLNNYFRADATDCYCMYLFIMKTYLNGRLLICNKREEVNDDTRDYLIYPEELDDFPDSMRITYNEHFSLQENVTFICNRTWKPCLGRIENVNWLKPEEIYGHARAFDSIPTSGAVTLLIVPRR